MSDNIITDEIKEKIEKYLRMNEGACNIVWGEDSCTTLDSLGYPIEDYMIDIEDNTITYCPVTNPSVNIIIE